MRFAIIHAERAAYPMTILCKALDVTRSGYYAWLGRDKSSRERTNEELSLRIVEIHKASRSTYGCPRIQAELKSQGHRVSRKRVARLMQKQGIPECVNEFETIELGIYREIADSRRWAASAPFAVEGFGGSAAGLRVLAGGLIHAAVGRGAGAGGPLTKRSGWAA